MFGQYLGPKGHCDTIKFPEHHSWLGAVAGTVADAASSSLAHAKRAITGEVEFRDAAGNKQSVPYSRMNSLKAIPQAFRDEYHNHTMVLTDPHQYRKWNDAVDAFRAGYTTYPGGPNR